MAQRRMTSLKIIDTDAFLDMGVSSRELYFQLTLRADDDGFIGNPKRIMRMIGSTDDDMKMLFAKVFVIPFKSGVCVITHWHVHNYIQKDRYQETQFLEEKQELELQKDGVYKRHDTKCIQNVSKLDTQVRLGKVRLGKVSKETKEHSEETSHSETSPKYTELGAQVLKAFEAVDAKNKTYYGNKTQRKSADFLISEYGLEKVLEVIGILPQTNKTPFMPRINSPYDLKEKWQKLSDGITTEKVKFQKRKPHVIV